MDILTIFGIALALAMDAFAVSLVVGGTLSHLTGRHIFRLSFHFGLFQALMPIIGWLSGMTIHKWIQAYDHWIAFGLLTLIGGRMIYEGACKIEEEVSSVDPTRGWSLIMLSIATSIDALAIGLTLAMINVSVWFPSLIIGLVAGILTVIGMLIGRRISSKWGERLEIVGGIVLIGIGAKILFEHLSV